MANARADARSHPEGLTKIEEVFDEKLAPTLSDAQTRSKLYALLRSQAQRLNPAFASQIPANDAEAAQRARPSVQERLRYFEKRWQQYPQPDRDLALRILRKTAAGEALTAEDKKALETVRKNGEARAVASGTRSEKRAGLADAGLVFPSLTYDLMLKIRSGETQVPQHSDAERRDWQIAVAHHLESGSVKLPRLPYDPRFPNQNISKRCWINYVDFFRCLEKNGDEKRYLCAQYEDVYHAVCPDGWIEAWDKQRGLGVFPGQEQILQ